MYSREQYSIKGTSEVEKKKKKLLKDQKVDETKRSTFLQLFESFMESAPQLLLQMYIIAAQVSTPRFQFSTTDRKRLSYSIVLKIAKRRFVARNMRKLVFD